jgi:3-oxoacyl-[acyl-carrier protein] reductase
VRFSGLSAIVTGGARGIGATICTRLAEEGAAVAVVDVDIDACEKLAERLSASGAKAAAFRCDVGNGEDVQALAEFATSTFPSLDILVNNAAIIRNSYLVKMTDAEWNQVLTTNLTGPFLCIRAIAPTMMAQKSGRIVNIASGSSAGMIGQANYSSAKAGLYGLTKTAALELASYNVNVNAVAPGFIVTEMSAQLAARAGMDTDDFISDAARRIPLLRAGQPADVAGAVAFLCSEDSSFITGQIVNVRGGPGPGAS